MVMPSTTGCNDALRLSAPQGRRGHGDEAAAGRPARRRPRPWCRLSSELRRILPPFLSARR